MTTNENEIRVGDWVEVVDNSGASWNFQKQTPYRVAQVSGVHPYALITLEGTGVNQSIFSWRLKKINPAFSQYELAPDPVTLVDESVNSQLEDHSLISVSEIKSIISELQTFRLAFQSLKFYEEKLSKIIEKLGKYA